MTKLNILLWVNLIILGSCAHHKEDILPELRLSGNSCEEKDSVFLQVFLNNTLYKNPVKWNLAGIIAVSDRYLLVPGQVAGDSLVLKITATVNEQECSQKLIVYNKESRLPPVSYPSAIQPLLTGNCNFSGCHGNGSRAGKIELSTYDSVIKSVTPFDAGSSLLYQALLKTDPLRIMPPAGKLHDYKIEEVRVWIEQGAYAD